MPPSPRPRSLRTRSEGSRTRGSEEVSSDKAWPAPRVEQQPQGIDGRVGLGHGGRHVGPLLLQFQRNAAPAAAPGGAVAVGGVQHQLGRAGAEGHHEALKQVVAQNAVHRQAHVGRQVEHVVGKEQQRQGRRLGRAQPHAHAGAEVGSQGSILAQAGNANWLAAVQVQNVGQGGVGNHRHAHAGVEQKPVGSLAVQVQLHQGHVALHQQRQRGLPNVGPPQLKRPHLAAGGKPAAQQQAPQHGPPAQPAAATRFQPIDKQPKHNAV
jgi:hypothetical protein